MSLHHAVSGELIDIRPLGDKLADAASIALIRTDAVEVMRLALPKGKSIPEHHVPGEITLQGLEGTVEVQMLDGTQLLQAGRLLHLNGNVRYALYALEDASILMTMLRKDD